MPRFHFDIHDSEVVLDDEGMERPDLDAAIREAVRSIPAIAAEAISKGDDRQNFAIIVRDSERRPVYTAAMSFWGTRL
jgi:hypothetical protein